MQAIKDLLPQVIANLEKPENKIKCRLLNEWSSIAGPKISKHTKPWLRNDGHLVVFVDQSVLAFELNQKYRNSLLKRTQAALGEETVKGIRFRVGQLR